MLYCLLSVVTENVKLTSLVIALCTSCVIKQHDKFTQSVISSCQSCRKPGQTSDTLSFYGSNDPTNDSFFTIVMHLFYSSVWQKCTCIVQSGKTRQMQRSKYRLSWYERTKYRRNWPHLSNQHTIININNKKYIRKNCGDKRSLDETLQYGGQCTLHCIYKCTRHKMKALTTDWP